MNSSRIIDPILISIILLNQGALGPSDHTTISVGDNCSYTRIGDAIRAAISGDTIEVHSGTFLEKVVIDKPVVLRGVDSGGGMPIVDAGGRGSAITLYASGVVLEGMMAINSGSGMDAGIRVISDDNIIKGNVLKDNSFCGIGLAYASNNTLRDNLAFNNTGGIGLASSNHNNISNNNLSGNWIGITLMESKYNKIEDNIINDNGDDGLYIYFSDLNSLARNNASNNGDDGIYLYISNNNTISSNDVSGNTDGIYIEGSEDNTLLLNRCWGNNRYDYYDDNPQSRTSREEEGKRNDSSNI